MHHQFILEGFIGVSIGNKHIQGIHTITRNTAVLLYRTIGYNEMKREDEERSKFGFRNEMLWVSIMSFDKILDKESLKQSILEGLSNEPEITTCRCR